MKKEEAWRHFNATVVEDVTAEHIRRLHAYYIEHKDALTREWLEAFGAFCLKIRTMQEKGEKSPIGFIVCSMLRTSLLSGTYTDKLQAYDSTWFLDASECEADYSAAWAFRFWEQWKHDLNARRKAYVDAISESQVERLALQKAPLFHLYVHHLIRYAMPRLLTMEELRSFTTAGHFEIRAGEYMDMSEQLYREERQAKDPIQALKWLKKKEELAYVYETIPAIDGSGADFAGLDFRYTVFRQADLTGSDMRFCIAMGTRFEACNLREADVRASCLYDADLRNCDLQGADLSEIHANQNTWDAEQCRYYGIEGINFTGANVAGASFAYAELAGAYFIDAIVDDADFTGANLDGALFSKEAAERLVLDESQRRSIRWV